MKIASLDQSSMSISSISSSASSAGTVRSAHFVAINVVSNEAPASSTVNAASLDCDVSDKTVLYDPALNIDAVT